MFDIDETEIRKIENRKVARLAERIISETAKCKYCVGEMCVNADCPLRADYCPVSDTPEVCKFEKRE